MQAMVDRDLARATRNQRKNAVNTLLGIAFRDGYISPDLARRLDVRPFKKRERKDEKPVGRRLDPGEVKRLRWAVTQAMNDAKHYRDTAILDLMLYAGLRRDEAANLNTGSLNQDGGRWWLVLQGKGGKTRRVKAHDVLFRSLEAWAAHHGITMGEGEEPLFCNLTKGGNSTGKQLSASVIGRLVAEYGHKANLSPLHGSNRLSPHDLRRTCARNAYDNGATILQVQNMLGHSDPKTTIRYIGADEDDSNTAVDFVNY
jgi:integrase